METLIDGYTRATFLYVLGYNLRSKARDKNQVKQIHSPGMYRAVPLQMWIPLSGVCIQVNDGMYMPQRKELKSGNKKYLIKNPKLARIFSLYVL
jgi:hypothetical protein